MLGASPKSPQKMLAIITISTSLLVIIGNGFFQSHQNSSVRIYNNWNSKNEFYNYIIPYIGILNVCLAPCNLGQRAGYWIHYTAINSESARLKFWRFMSLNKMENCKRELRKIIFAALFFCSLRIDFLLRGAAGWPQDNSLPDRPKGGRRKRGSGGHRGAPLKGAQFGVLLPNW